MTKTKIEDITEREYIIPLRKEWKKVPKYRRAEKAIKAIKEFLVKHMKVYDRDLNKIKIDKYLNEEVWFRGIKKPPMKIKVKAIKQGDIVRVELVDYPENLKFKKQREEKVVKEGAEIAKKKAQEKKSLEQKEAEKEKKETNEEDKEKKAAVVEAGQKSEKAEHKKTKHETKINAKEPKHQKRKALQK